MFSDFVMFDDMWFCISLTDVFHSCKVLCNKEYAVSLSQGVGLVLQNSWDLQSEQHLGCGYEVTQEKA